MDEYELAKHNDWIMTEAMTVRDMLAPILEGVIERGHCLPGKHAAYLDKPGFRKLMLADARNLVRHATARLNKLVDEINKS